jgi:hypothetical protein
VTFDADRFVALDLETSLIETGLLAPPIVCGSTADLTGGRLLYDGGPRAAISFAKALLLSSAVIVGANISYDFGCLAAAEPSLIAPIFKAYEDGRVYDVQIAQALHAIACGNLYQDPETGEPLEGRYSLDRCVRFVLGRDDAKARDEWRKRYAILAGLPLEEWPDEAKQYPVDDAVNTLAVARAQVLGGGAGPTPGPHRNLGDLSPQIEAAFALHLGAMWGMRTDQEKVKELRARVEKERGAFVERFRKLGFFKLDSRGDLVLSEKSGQPKEDQGAIKRAVVIAYNGGRSKCPAGCIAGKTLSLKTGSSINCKACSGTGLDISGVPRTDTDGVCANRDALVDSGDPELAAFGDNEAKKTLTTYLPKLESEEVGRMLRPNVLVASGRTSYDGVIQLMPKYGGERECLRARPGRVLCSVDFSALELCTWAQVKLILFGRSVMADTINATGKPGALHTALAAALAGRTTEEMTAALESADAATKAGAKKYREAAKAGNFGFPGGMGPAKFIFSKRRKNEGTTTAPDGFRYPGIRLCILLDGAMRCGEERLVEWRGRPTNLPPLCKRCVELADRLRGAWFRQWPEAKPYLDWVSDRVGEFGGAELPCFRTERVRGGLDFTNAANNGFQALAADGAKHALRTLTRECYLDRSSPLYGTRPIFFVHDEIVAEIPEPVAHEAASRMSEVMVGAMREYVPDVTIVAEPALMRWWTKSAESVYRDGRLVPWEDREVKHAA